MSSKEREWIAHVSYVTGGVIECKVKSRKNSKYAALTKVYQQLNLSGPNDQQITGIMLLGPDGDTHVVGKGPTPVPKDKSNWKRYTVSLYPTRLSRDLKTMIMKAATAEDALGALAAMHGVKNRAQIGPYMVEEHTPDGLVTRLINDPTAMRQVKPDSFSRGTPSPPPSSRPALALVSNQRECCIDAPRCEEEKRCCQVVDARRSPALTPHIPSTAVVPARTTEQDFVTKIREAMQRETKARPTLYTIKRH